MTIVASAFHFGKIYFGILVLLIFVCYQGSQLEFLFNGKTRLVNYSELPLDVKNPVDEFIVESQKYGINGAAAKDWHYVILDSNRVDFGGYTEKLSRTLFINVNSHNPRLITKLVWHELGHAILGYGHDFRPNETHIMTPSLSFDSVPWEAQKRRFFLEPVKSDYFGQLKFMVTADAWYFGKLKKMAHQGNFGLVLFSILFIGFVLFLFTWLLAQRTGFKNNQFVYEKRRLD